MPIPSPGYLPNPVIEDVSPAWQSNSLPYIYVYVYIYAFTYMYDFSHAYILYIYIHG